MSEDPPIFQAVIHAREDAKRELSTLRETVRIRAEERTQEKKRAAELTDEWDEERAAICMDVSYAAGMLLGWNLCVEGLEDRFNKARGDRMIAAAKASKERKTRLAPQSPIERFEDGAREGMEK